MPASTFGPSTSIDRRSSPMRATSRHCAAHFQLSRRTKKAMANAPQAAPYTFIEPTSPACWLVKPMPSFSPSTSAGMMFT